MIPNYLVVQEPVKINRKAQIGFVGIIRVVLKMADEIQHRKCKVMHIGVNNRDADYEIAGHKLEKVSEEKDLGVIVRKNFKVSDQRIKVASKGNQILGLINRTIYNMLKY